MYIDIYRLMNENRKDIKNKLLKKFDSFHNLKKYAEKRNDISLTSRIMVRKGEGRGGKQKGGRER